MTKKILVLFMPVMPHLSNECYEKLFKEQFLTSDGWPQVDKKLLKEKFSNIVIQINGRKRGILKLPIDTSESIIAGHAKNINNIKKNIKNKKILKQIYIKNKLLNFITQ